MVMAIILFMGAVSGAHLNPAVTFAFALRGDFPWRRVPGYIVAQLLGATLAWLFLWAVSGGSAASARPSPARHHDWQAMLIEIVLTVGLVSAILGTASGAQNVGALSAIAVGGYIILAGLWSSPISGASMNPARSFGPDLVNGDFRTTGSTSSGRWSARSSPSRRVCLRGPGGDMGGMTAARGSEPGLPKPPACPRSRTQATNRFRASYDRDDVTAPRRPPSGGGCPARVPTRHRERPAGRSP